MECFSYCLQLDMQQRSIRRQELQRGAQEYPEDKHQIKIR